MRHNSEGVVSSSTTPAIGAAGCGIGTATAAVGTATADDETRCHDECAALGFCCNDFSVGSNQLLSCAQACMVRARGAGADTCSQACDEQDASRGCARTVGGHTYHMCQACHDLDDSCPHGVQQGAGACQAGCIRRASGCWSHVSR